MIPPSHDSKMAAPVVLILFCSLFGLLKAEFAVVERDSATGAIRLTSEPRAEILAWANFTDSINATGWAVLDLETSPDVDDMTQAYAAGLLEGHLTRNLSQMQWHNSVHGYCQDSDPDKAYCHKLATFLQTNLLWMYRQIALNPNSAYWHQIVTQLAQINGISDGIKGRQSRPWYYINDMMGIYLMHVLDGDNEALEQALGKKERSSVTGSGSCSALIKLLPGYSDLFASHDTWSTYQTMLRINKRYKFHMHQTSDPNSPLLPGNEVTFSGYPATIWSGDDFYTMNSGLVSIETTIGNNNASLWSLIKPQTVLENFRVTIGNRLATKTEEWATLFAKYNSGTYNNQWMIVDYNQFTPGRRPADKGLLWVLEQLPGLIVSQDKTQQLLKDGYWASFNIPYYPEIFKAGGNDAMVRKFGPWFSHEYSPRNQIFKRDQHKVVDMPSMLKMMRYNDYRHDPLSYCEKCTPHQNAENAISARCDLNPKNGTYPFGALEHRIHGGTDCKITTWQLMKTQSFVAVSGPTSDNLPPFRWSTSDFAASTPHVGHPDLFNFKPVLVDWKYKPTYLRRMVGEESRGGYNVEVNEVL